MKLHTIKINNFRSFETFTLNFGGQSLFLTGECGVGKTTLLTAINRGLGKDRSFSKADFRDIGKAIEIELALNEFDKGQIAALSERINFADGTLAVGVRATWDNDEEEVTVEHGFPKNNWVKSAPDEREALRVFMLPAEREVGKYLNFGYRRNLMGKILEKLNIDELLKQTSEGIKQIVDDLAANKEFQGLLGLARNEMAGLIPGVSIKCFSLTSTPSTDLEILRLLALYLAYFGENVGVDRHSSGLGQLAIFSFLVQLAQQQPGTLLLVDQPELSLHPQPQRALVKLIDSLPSQCLYTTHSSSVLNRVDPRRMIRLHRTSGHVEAAQPTGLTETEAQRYARYTTSQTAEVFFAKAVILVEGLSDLFAITVIAERIGKKLDSEGISVVDMDGAGGLRTFVGLLGSNGFKINLAGVCDVDKEADWGKVLKETGVITSATRKNMNAAGFYVCDRDLEDELIRAYGAANVQSLIDSEGETAEFQKFSLQPSNRGKPIEEQLRGFCQTTGRKVRYAPLIAELIPLGNLPPSIQGVLSHV